MTDEKMKVKLSVVHIEFVKDLFIRVEAFIGDDMHLRVRTTQMKETPALKAALQMLLDVVASEEMEGETRSD